MQKSVLIIVTGSIAAYKTLDVIRRLREHNIKTTVILTKGGAEFVTPLALASLSGNPIYTDLFSLKDESEIGHIRLSREHDLIAVIPASADIIAKMANGLCDDLASAALLASDKPIIIAPAMNSKMWEKPATQRNIAQLRQDGVKIIEPASGELACGEIGKGKLPDVELIVAEILSAIESDKLLHGVSALVTSGATYEAIDPVRFIGNRSSGKQGHAIAAELARAGAKVTLVSGVSNEPIPHGVSFIQVETADEMLAACQNSLPADIGVFCAAVADWKIKHQFATKLKKRANELAPNIELIANPDILRTIASGKKRPKFVVGFAAETENLKKNATEKLKNKNCDMIVANDVSGGKIFGKESTTAFFIGKNKFQEFKGISKIDLAKELVNYIIKEIK